MFAPQEFAELRAGDTLECRAGPEAPYVKATVASHSVGGLRVFLGIGPAAANAKAIHGNSQWTAAPGTHVWWPLDAKLVLWGRPYTIRQDAIESRIRDKVLPLVDRDGAALALFEEDPSWDGIRGDFVIMLAAVTHSGLLLAKATWKLRQDPELVIPAVLNTGMAFR